MDLREIERLVKETKGGIIEKKETLIPILTNPANDVDEHGHAKPKPTNSASIDSGSALQLFLDHIPISSLHAITNSSSVLKFRTHDSLNYAIRTMYDKDIFAAPIIDNIEFDPDIINHSDPYVGIIDFASMVLWFLEECENYFRNKRDDDLRYQVTSGIFSMLEQVHHIAETKIGELAKSYLWEPFFPISSHDTLFHVLLLLSKHQLHLVPVVEGHKTNITGFITESAVVDLLLQSSGLEWFDDIADKSLSEFRFDKQPGIVYEDQSIVEAMSMLWVNRICAVAVVQRQTERIIGCVRISDVYHLLDNDDIFNNRKTVTVDHFIQLEPSTADSDPTVDQNLNATTSALDSDETVNQDHDASTTTTESNPTSTETLSLRNKLLPRMNLPVTIRTTNSLKQAMEALACSKSNVCFLVDDAERVTGLLTLRDIIIQFAPPCMDSTITGGRFFEDALEQSGCDVKDRTLILESNR
ncbi:SNF1-related protein kinase regulatory subunit gamma-1 like [Heracleum sosnowskyi]|uniref:SNF1-related protein kinase regulatory subunit gamma-1 like n=1 Tax=Heracleum sosnowskyi TaxID=360622 RepID=A0AAD8LXN6_9APIA|nr:SNF1-related protein kinase regulatory subunit gamma-1 like [Heracleum sosnowskyi]